MNLDFLGVWIAAFFVAVTAYIILSHPTSVSLMTAFANGLANTGRAAEGR